MKRFSSYSIDCEHQGLTVEEYLKNILQISGRKIQKLTRQKGFLLNKKNAFLQKKIKTGDVLSVLNLEDQSYGVIPEEGNVDVLYEDSCVIVLNKSANLLVHPAGHTTHGTLANYLAWYFQERKQLLTIRPLHRLDRDTTGCVVFAKDTQTQSQLEQQLHNGECKRTYYGIIEGTIDPPAGTINEPIGLHPSKPNRRTVTEKGENAITHYKTIKSLPEMSLLELSLETGRTHQIRVHLANSGHPIVGDKMYGKGSSRIARQALHAKALTFVHPVDHKVITVQAPLPPDMERCLEIVSKKFNE